MTSRHRAAAAAGKHGLARTLSKLGVCSRTQAATLIRAGRVTVDTKLVLDPERRTDPACENIAIDGVSIREAQRTYIAMNKPRGLVVTTADEQGRDTIYRLLENAKLPWLAPVGRLDKASEGLLLLSNDPEWAAAITDPNSTVLKTYHVQVSGLPSNDAFARMLSGIDDGGEHLRAVAARVLRAGGKNAWLEIVLDAGRNRHIRRMLATLGHDVLRLVRIAIGSIELGDLAKGQWRYLTEDECKRLGARNTEED